MSYIVAGVAAFLFAWMLRQLAIVTICKSAAVATRSSFSVLASPLYADDDKEREARRASLALLGFAFALAWRFALSATTAGIAMAGGVYAGAVKWAEIGAAFLSPLMIGLSIAFTILELRRTR